MSGMGQYEYRVKSLADDQLLAGLASIVLRRNQVTAEFLAYLAELDERQLFLDLGYSSVFEYCVEKLKLCESTAGRHIAAARVCRTHPKAFALVASGTLHASALSLLKKYLTTENAAELFELCMHRSARQVETLLAERFPRPNVRDLVRRLPAQAQPTLNVGSSGHLQPTLNIGGCGHAWPALNVAGSDRAQPALDVGGSAKLGPTGSHSPKSLELQSAPGTEPTRDVLVAPMADEKAKPRRFEPLSADRYGVHFTADGEFCELLDRVRGLAGHRLPSGDLMTVLKRGLEAYERELEKERSAVGPKARARRAASASHAPCTPNVRRATAAGPPKTDPS